MILAWRRTSAVFGPYEERSFFSKEDRNLSAVSLKKETTVVPVVGDMGLGERFPGALAKQFVPMDPKLWTIERYPDFLEARRNLIALKLNEFMDSLISDPEVVHEKPTAEIIRLGESATLEFKSTLQWDIMRNEVNKALRKQVLKTIAAFLNSSGGTLVIGVEDDGNIYGIEKDLNTLNNSKDKFSILLSTLITDYIGAELSPFISFKFEGLNGNEICVVDVERGPIPAFVRGDRGSEFFTRIGPTSKMLDPEETVSYIDINWD